MKCDLAGEDGEKGRRGRVPSSYGMWWEQYLGLPSPPQPWLGSGFGTPSQCGLYDSLPLLTRIFPSINFGGRGGCKYCFLKKWIWWYVLVMALPIWSSSIELNWISWTTNSSKTIAQYIHENKYYITLPSLQNLVLFWSRYEKFLLSRSYCLALLLGQFLGGVVEMFSEFILSVQLTIWLGEPTVREPSEGQPPPFLMSSYWCSLKKKMTWNDPVYLCW